MKRMLPRIESCQGGIDVEREQPSWAPDPQWGLEGGESELPFCFRSEDALEEIANRCAVISLGDEQCQAALKALTASEASQIIVEACLKHDVTAEETDQAVIIPTSN